MDCSIISPALSLLVKHLVIGSTFTEKDRNELNYRSRPNHQIGPGCAGHA